MLLGSGRPAGATEEERRLTEDHAYERTLVLGNDGRVQQRVVAHVDVDDTIAQLGNHLPGAWFAARRGADRDRLVLFAHGGLNDEEASIARVRVLGKLFEDNGIYPLFFTWKTGVFETIGSMLGDRFADLVRPFSATADVLESVRDRMSEAKDRAIEVAARQVLVRALWMEMKENAAAAAAPGGGAERLAQALGALAARREGRLDVHLVGHSAGSILLGHLLPALGEALGSVASCTLYAPACTVSLANETFRRAVEAKQLAAGKLRVHVLSDERERADAVGPYGKSLLYLVSRALEREHKTPILGLARAFDSKFNGLPQWNDERPELRDRVTADLVAWQRFWVGLPGSSGKRLVVEERADVSMGSDPAAGTTPAVHGCFDNSAPALNETLALILGRRPPVPVRDLRY